MAYPKEGVEALKGLLALTAVLAEHFKDGVQATDLAPVLAKLQSEPLKTMLVEAYNGADKVPQELQNVETMDILMILPQIVPDLIKLMEALKK